MSLSIGSNNTIYVRNIRDLETDTTPGTISSVTARVLDDQGNEVTGITQPITLSPIGGGPDYSGQIGAAAQLSDGSRYDVEVTVVADGMTRILRQRHTARYT